MSAWDVSIEILPVLASLTLSLSLLWYVLRRAESPGAMYIAWIMIGQFGWGLAYLVQLTTRYRDLIVLVDHLMLLIVPVPVIAWFLFALEYAGYEDWHRTPVLAFAFSVPVLTWILVPTNAIHMWFWSEYVVEFGVGSGLVLPDSTKGIWFWVHGIHLYVLVVIACLLVIRRTLYTYSVFRKQTLLLLVGATVPLVVNIADRLQYTTIDYSAVSLSVTATALLFGLYRYELFDLVPVARDTVVEEIRDAVIVINRHDRIVDLNAAATDLLQVEDSAVGEHASDTLPFKRLETDGGRPTGGQSLTLNDGHTERHYRLTTTPIETDRSDKQLGRVLVLQEVTELKRREQELQRTNEQLAETNAALERTNDELEILNRMIRHDIQNDMSIVKGYAQLLETELDADQRELLEPILQNTDHAIELTETVRDLVRSICGEGELEIRPVDLREIVETEVQKARHAHDEATVDLEIAETIDESGLLVRGNEMLSSVVHNLLSNAIRHNDTTAPTVTVDLALDRQSETVTVRVADDGPGIPAGKHEAIFGRGEKGLDSPGTGMGLYLVDSLVEQFGGTVTARDNEPRGAVFVVELDHAASTR
jgi:signal transduction histidine kinase